MGASLTAEQSWSEDGVAVSASKLVASLMAWNAFNPPNEALLHKITKALQLTCEVRVVWYLVGVVCALLFSLNCSVVSPSCVRGVFFFFFF
jgi:hypothetical protein